MWGTAGLVAGGLVVLLLMAEGVSMQLGGTGTTRLPQASASLRQEKVPRFLGPPHPALSWLQEDSGWRGLQPAESPAPHPALGKWQWVRGCQGHTAKAIS